MITIKLSAKDTQTVARIIAEKAVEMNKKGAMWMRGDEELSLNRYSGTFLFYGYH